MPPSDIEKVKSAIAGFGRRDSDAMTRYVNPSHFIQHNPAVADGIDGLKAEVVGLTENHELQVIRAFQDGPFVFSQTAGSIGGQGVFFDIFKFDDGLMVEHWIFSAPAAPPNRSGHTQTDGPTEARFLEQTEKNKAFMRDYYETFHIKGDHSNYQRFFKGNLCIRHEPGVVDGVDAFIADVAQLMQHRTIDEIKFLLGQGDFVFIVAVGTHEKEPVAYTDLYRIEDGAIVEHWGFPQPIPPREKRKNDNGVI